MMNVIGTMIVCVLCFSPAVASAEKVADVVAVRGDVRVLRGEQSVTARLKTPVERSDTIVTAQNSAAKILFQDDSILTIAENSKMRVSEYVPAAEQKRSRSVFNLLFGKMRVVVGRTMLQISTDTAVAGVKGTIFDIWVDQGTGETHVAVLEGSVELKNIDPKIKGSQVVTEGNTSSVSSGKPPKKQLPMTGTGGPGTLFGPGDGDLPPPDQPPAGGPPGPGSGYQGTSLPPIHQMPNGFSKVGINVVFP